MCSMQNLHTNTSKPDAPVVPAVFHSMSVLLTGDQGDQFRAVLYDPSNQALQERERISMEISDVIEGGF